MSGLFNKPTPVSGTGATQASNYKAVTGGTVTAQVINPNPGRYFGVIVITSGTSAVPITDGVGGPQIGVITANAQPGPYPSINVPAFTSLNVPAGTNYPTFTVFYA